MAWATVVFNELELIPNALEQGIATQTRHPCLHEYFQSVRIDLQILPKIHRKMKHHETLGKDFSYFENLPR
jgi:hypothetical protein